MRRIADQKKIEIAITKLSSKGQIVLPQEIRYDIKKGEKLLLIRSDGYILMKRANKLKRNLLEDLEFAKRTEEAWKRYDKGNFTSSNVKDFLKEMKKW